MHSIIQINELSKTPKYKQIVQSILTGIETGKLIWAGPTGLSGRLPGGG